ncbi:Uncharacterised protein [Candidatus Burarchaeum australiense]|nr:Uncharacterised protein [Candidatus Burarchaeum australiense]
MVELRTALMAVVVLVILGAVYVVWQGQVGGGGIMGPTKNATAILLLGAENAAKTTTYVMESTASTNGATPIYANVTVSGLRARVDLIDASEVLRVAYLLPEGNFVCLPERDACVEVASNTSSSELRNIMIYARSQVVNVNVTKVREWVLRGIIAEANYTNSEVIAGRPCEGITYRIHLDLMSGSDLRGTGYDPSVAPYVIQTINECLDEETGFALHYFSNNSLLGQQTLFTLNVTSLDSKVTTAETDFAPKEKKVGEAEFIALDAEEVDRKSCLGLPDEEKRNTCLEQKAWELRSTDYCDFIESQAALDRCYMLFVPILKDVKLCEKIVTLKDDCYYELGIGLGNATLCDTVKDVQKKALCNVVLGENPVACLGLAQADNCASAIAERTGNVTICAQIVNATLRKNCVGE